MHDSNPLATFSHVLHELNRFNLAYAHLIMPTENDLRQGATAMSLAALQQEFRGPLIVANNFTYTTATQVLEENLADAAAFERLFIANPDLPGRFWLNAPMNPPDESPFFYGGVEKGHPDYPAPGP
jgi:N-ethylmaleimide reductase